MSSAGRASVALGAATVVQIACGLVVAKFLAVYTGVDGVGLQGLCLAVGSLAALVGGLGVGSALVRALGTKDGAERRILSVATVTWFRLIGIGVPALMYLVILLFGTSALGLGELSPLQGVPLCLGVACALFQVGELAVLTAHRASTAIATAIALGAVAGGGSAVALVVTFGYPAIVSAYFVTQASAWLAAYAMRRRTVGGLEFRPRSSSPQIRLLVGHGVAIALSTAVGSGVQVLMPLVIQPISGMGTVGLFRSVTAITTGVVGVMAVALSRDYYPRVAASTLAALRDKPREQQRMLLAAAVPIVIAGAMFAGPLLAIAYSQEFTVARTFFGIQLTGEVVRLISWTYAYILLARAGRGTYLVLEASAGGLLLVLGVFGLRLFGINGLGIAYLVTYVAYLVAAAELCRRRFGVRPNWAMAGTLAVAGAAALLLLGDWTAELRIVIACAALAFAALLLFRSTPTRPTPDVI